jgi:hypothetical protein
VRRSSSTTRDAFKFLKVIFHVTRCGSEQVTGGDVGKDLRGNEREVAVTRAALARFLEETAPNNYRARQWGSLRRTRMSDNSYRWLCENCATNVR